jgi:hypothetical protein
MKGKTMKVSAMLFSLLIACQAMPVAMHAATAQPGAMPSVDMGEVQRAQFADQFGPERLRTEYNNVVSRSSQFLGKRQAVTYDFVVDINMALAGGNSMKNQTRSSYAYDKDGRMRFVSSIAGLERIIIVDPTTQAAYVVCPERKEVLRMTGAALVSPPDTAAPKMPEADKSGTRTDLGDKTIAGVRAHGVRIEKTIPAGARGNDKPMVETVESWYSTDLAALVYSHTFTSELGDIVMQVENLKFGDVPASTFALPEAYAIRDIALARNEAK